MLCVSAAPCDIDSNRVPFYLIGDSHVLTHAWRNMTVGGQAAYAVPKLVTGLKAWHMREGFEFLTTANLEMCLESIPKGSGGSRGRALFVCGEIDCREGLPNALAKNKYESIQQAVAATVEHYIAGLKRLETKHSIQFLVLSITPPTNPQYKLRVQATKLFNAALNKQLGKRFIDISETVSSVEGLLKPEYNCDGTHMNRKAAMLVEERINAAWEA